MTQNRRPADLATLNRNQLREVAREIGVPLRLTKGAMLKAIQERLEPSDPHRQRQALGRVPVKFYHPGDPLEGQTMGRTDRPLLTSKRAQSRFFRRHQVFEAAHKSRNPFRPQYIITRMKRPMTGILVPYVAPRGADGKKIKDWR